MPRSRSRKKSYKPLVINAAAALSAIRQAPPEPRDAALPPTFTAPDVLFYALLCIPILALIIFKLFLMQQPADPDDGGFINPILEYVHHGRVVYPAHGPDHAQAMTIHPPVHYWLAGLMIKAGLSLYPALGTMPFVTAVLCLLAIAASPFSKVWKVSMVYGVFAVNFIVLPTQLFRPEMELSFAWFAGATLLASARLQNWSPTRLLAGSFLTAYASGLHYFGAPAILACGIYAVWVILDVGVRRALRSVLYIALGACSFLIPYLVLFVIPERHDIGRVISGLHAVATPSRGNSLGELIDAFRYHRQVYIDNSVALRGVLAALLFPMMRLGIPSAFICIPIMYGSAQVRGVALASVPLLLPLLFLFKHKYLAYFRCELSLAYAALLFTVLVALRWVVMRIGEQASERRFAIGVIVVLSLLAVLDIRPWQVIQGYNLVDEVALERAFGKDILGPNALVAGRSICLWYTSGGAYYRNVTGDLIYPRDISNLDPANFFSTFDGVAEDGNGSWVTYNKQQMSLSSWYLNGTLQLLGLYCVRDAVRPWYLQVGYYLAGTHRTQPVQAIFWRGKTPFRFTASRQGDVALLAVSARTGQSIDAVRPGEFIFRLALAPDGKRELQFHIVPEPAASSISHLLPADCAIRDLIHGHVQPANEGDMLRSVNYRKDMATIFYTAEEARATQATPVQGEAPIYVVTEKALPGVDVHELDHSSGHIRVQTPPAASIDALSSPLYDLHGDSWYLLNFDLKLDSGNLALDIVDSQGGGLYQIFRNHSQPFQQQRAVFRVHKPSKIAFQVWTNNASPETTKFQLKHVYLQRVDLRK